MAEKPWSGRFADRTDPRVEKFTESVSFDRRLYAHDIAASIAHAQMLADVGLLSPEERDQIVAALEAIRGQIEAGRFHFSAEREDIHMHVEAALIERLGDVGRKLHTGRSRNDQVSTDLRLWVRDAIDTLDDQLLALQRAFVARAESDADIVLPGYTH
ncbi:MAG: lyase family protein, partial [Pirellulales bacterium]